MLYKLKETDYQNVRPLIKEVNHNHSVAAGVVGGFNKGQIYADHIKNPTSVFIYPEGAFSFIISKTNSKSFLEDLNHLFFNEWKTDILELLIYPDTLTDDLTYLLEKRKFIKLIRNEYHLDLGKFHCLKLSSLEKPYQLMKIDEDILTNHQIELKTWKSKAAFLNQGLGYCILKENELIAHCLSYFRCDDEIEIIIETKEDYRNKGFGSLVSQALVKDVLNNKLQPKWSCWEFNEASNKLAQKLGFVLSNKKNAIIWDHYIDKE